MNSSLKRLCLKGKDICSVQQLKYQWFISIKWNSFNKEWSPLIQVITNIFVHTAWIAEPGTVFHSTGDFKSVFCKYILYESHRKYHTRLSRTIHLGMFYLPASSKRQSNCTWTTEKKKTGFSKMCLLHFLDLFFFFLVLLTWTPLLSYLNSCYFPFHIWHWSFSGSTVILA